MAGREKRGDSSQGRVTFMEFLSGKETELKTEGRKDLLLFPLGL